MRRTPGKVNLYLTVGEERPTDGRHEIKTIFYPYWPVCDEISVTPSAVGSGLTLECEGREIPGDPSDNLVCRAVAAYCREFSLSVDFHITIKKRIPVGGGMGGGSSDCAAALLEVDGLMHKADASTLHRLAASLGADVPFFLNPVPSQATGIGEVLTPFKDFPELPLLAIYPNFESPVAWAYRNWRRPEGLQPPQWPLDEKTDWTKCLWNDLGFAVAEKYPPIQEALDALKEHGALNAIVSGSGSTVFGIFATNEARDAAKAALPNAF